jgi:hypothetical protein
MRLFEIGVSPYTKAALFAIRLIAAGLVILSLCLYSTDLFLLLSHRPLNFGAAFILKGFPIVAGLVLYAKSAAMAERFTRDLD